MTPPLHSTSRREKLFKAALRVVGPAWAGLARTQVRKGQRSLRGRTLKVSDYLRSGLQDGEVVLTFDDGPAAKISPAILAALELFDAPAIFLMVGTMAENFAAEARSIAASGHLVGSHTHTHPDLTGMDADAALVEINRGFQAISSALAPIRPSRLFRSPYLLTNEILAARIAAEGYWELPSDYMPKDFADAPRAWVGRALSYLEEERRGTLVLHDIQWRTAIMLPHFLRAVGQRGYSIVRVVEG